MRSLYCNGNHTKSMMVSDKLYHLLEAEKSRMMAWLDDFNMDTSVHKTETYWDMGQEAVLYETISSYSLSDDIINYWNDKNNKKEVYKLVFDENDKDMTDGYGNIVYERSTLDEAPYPFLFMIYNFPDLCYKILEVYHCLGDMDLHYHVDRDDFTFSTIIRSSDLKTKVDFVNRYQAHLLNKIEKNMAQN